MTRHGRSSATKVLAFPVAALFATGLASCTSSLPTAVEGGPPTSTSLSVIVPGGVNGDVLAADFVEATGMGVEVVADEDQWQRYAEDGATLPPNTVLVGVGPADADASDTPYGRDFACLVGNDAWFATNRMSPPADLVQVTHLPWAPLWEVPNPTVDPLMALWVAGQAVVPDATSTPDGLVLLLQDAYLSGASFPETTVVVLPVEDEPTDAVETPQSGPATPEPLLPTVTSAAVPRIVVQSALFPWRTVNNLGTESPWRTIDSTCVEFTVSARGSGEDSVKFIDFLLSPAGQQSSVMSGLAYPLSVAAPIPSGVEAVANVPRGTLPVIPMDNWEGTGNSVAELWGKLSPSQ